ncbi:site-specific integrase [Hymenobacter sp. AT01-02]|uniref:site-specific integrase n=1 Tax=Hymenobacter sp. AT01-02 TaxID=1571877 RepID=UPI0005F0D75A|nr:site-specific integrase [Hymenobacter sp. AT01-02]
MSRTTEHKEGQATVRTYYKVGKTLADGSHPFLIRITKNRKQIYRSTGLSLHPKYWNPEKQEIRRSYPEPQRTQLLLELQKWELKYTEAAKSLALFDERHDAGSVLVQAATERKQLRRVHLLEYVGELITAMLESGQAGNARVYRDLRNQLSKFISAEFNTTDIPFEKVTVSFCNRWEIVLRAAGAKETTFSNRFRTLRAVLNKAIAAGDAKSSYYPFARNAAERHKFSIGKFDVSTTKRAISRESVRRLEALQPGTRRLCLARSLFLFSFYCGGINFVDMAKLRWSNFTEEEAGAIRLRYERQKTGGKFIIKLLTPAVEILNSYRSPAPLSPQSYVFPVLHTQRHLTSTQIQNRLHKMLAWVNQDLKVLALQANITTPLTTYVARHSFATSLKKGGVATSMISEAMGHSSEAVTMTYLDSFDSETMDAVFNQLL